MELIDVYQEPLAGITLWRLLIERDDTVNISHKEMPSYKDHLEFIDSTPYPYWYLMWDVDFVGSIYLTEQREIGVFIFKDHFGKAYAAHAVDELMSLHPGRFLANINPKNESSIHLFEKLGFRHIQNTYEL